MAPYAVCVLCVCPSAVCVVCLCVVCVCPGEGVEAVIRPSQGHDPPPPQTHALPLVLSLSWWDSRFPPVGKKPEGCQLPPELQASWQNPKHRKALTPRQEEGTAPAVEGALAPRERTAAARGCFPREGVCARLGTRNSGPPAPSSVVSAT